MKTIAAGFTLIELMVTLAIVALLATIVLPVAEVAVQREKEQELRLALRAIRTAIDAHKLAIDEGRIVRMPGASGYPATLQAMVHGTRDARDPKGGKIYFLRQVPRDPFFPDPQAKPEDTWGKRSYVSEAHEPREGEDVFDVYSLSNQQGLNGLPYRQW
jgi:general secretion pathway protein G